MQTTDPLLQLVGSSGADLQRRILFPGTKSEKFMEAIAEHSATQNGKLPQSSRELVGGAKADATKAGGESAMELDDTAGAQQARPNYAWIHT